MRSKVIVIESRALIRDLLTCVVDGQDAYEVVGQTGFAWHALELSRQLQPAIAIVGLPLPDLDGAETLRRLRRELPGCRILVFSGLTWTDSLGRGVLDARPDGFICEDESLGHLWHALEAAASGDFSRAAPSANHRALGLAPRGGGAGPSLSRRECEVIGLLAEGRTSKDICTRLGVAVRTVENHRARMKTKLGVRSTAELIRFAIEHRLGPREPTRARPA